MTAMLRQQNIDNLYLSCDCCAEAFLLCVWRAGGQVSVLTVFFVAGCVAQACGIYAAILAGHSIATVLAGMNNKLNIVSSSHLVSEHSAELSEFEFGLMVANHAFNRWMMRCMAAAGEKGLTAMEVSLVHHVNHRGREKKLADICFVLNIEDTHVVSYALKKLVRLGYVQSRKEGKEVLFGTTAEGEALCERYREVREQCLISMLQESGISNEEIGHTAKLMRMLAGMYDQASRSGASL